MCLVFGRSESQQRLHLWLLWWDRGRPPGDTVPHPGGGVQPRLPVRLQHEEGEAATHINVASLACCQCSNAGLLFTAGALWWQKTQAFHRLEDDVPPAVKQRRLQDCITVFRQEAAKLNADLVGTTQLVLVEGVSTTQHPKITSTKHKQIELFPLSIRGFPTQSVTGHEGLETLVSSGTQTVHLPDLFGYLGGSGR